MAIWIYYLVYNVWGSRSSSVAHGDFGGWKAAGSAFICNFNSRS